MEKTTKCLMDEKEKQIKDILMDEKITYGMAKNIIDRISADLLNEGNKFLKRSQLRNVFPSDN